MVCKPILKSETKPIHTGLVGAQGCTFVIVGGHGM